MPRLKETYVSEQYFFFYRFIRTFYKAFAMKFSVEDFLFIRRGGEETLGDRGGISEQKIWTFSV